MRPSRTEPVARAVGRRTYGPDIPAEIEARDLDRTVRAELRSLPKGAADTVARHLVAAGLLLDVDPAVALQHAQAARSQAARIPSVREAVGLAAYRAGEWRTAIAELRAWKRFTGADTHLPLIADAERAMGRPEKALALADAPEVRSLDTGTRIELLIVAAGAEQDLGDPAAAVERLRVPELRSSATAPWTARLRYAYAEALLADGAPSEQAREWFLAAAEVDEDEETDAGDRALMLEGVSFVDEDYDPDDDGNRDVAEDTGHGGAEAAPVATDRTVGRASVAVVAAEPGPAEISLTAELAAEHAAESVTDSVASLAAQSTDPVDPVPVTDIAPPTESPGGAVPPGDDVPPGGAEPVAVAEADVAAATGAPAAEVRPIVAPAFLEAHVTADTHVEAEAAAGEPDSEGATDAGGPGTRDGGRTDHAGHGGGPVGDGS